MSSPNDSPLRFEYFRGYPERFRRDREQTIRGAMIWPGIPFLASLVGVAASTYAVSVPILERLADQHFSPLAARELFRGLFLLVPLTVLAALFGWGVWANLHVELETTIVPYFPRPLGEIDCFASGHAIARNCQALDELAIRCGLTPLSAFGFNDDMAGEELVWHSAELGLETFNGLLLTLQQEPRRYVQHAQLIKELTAVQHALQRASDQGFPFCLLLRTCGYTSAMEWECRQGSCF